MPLDKYSIFDKLDRGLFSVVLAVMISGARVILRPDSTVVKSALVFVGSILLSVGIGFILHQLGGMWAKFDYVGVAVFAFSGKEITQELPKKIPGLLYTLITAFMPKPKSENPNDTPRNDNPTDRA